MVLELQFFKIQGVLPYFFIMLPIFVCLFWFFILFLDRSGRKKKYRLFLSLYFFSALTFSGYAVLIFRHYNYLISYNSLLSILYVFVPFFSSIVFFYIGTVFIKYKLSRATSQYSFVEQRRKSTDQTEDIEDTKQDVIVDKSLKQNLMRLFIEYEVFKKPELRISDISYMLNTNRTYISNILNKELGISFCDYVNKFRIEYAKKLLNSPTNEHMLLADIAEEAGFSNERSFYRIFRRHVGMTPYSYRKRNEKYSSV